MCTVFSITQFYSKYLLSCLWTVCTYFLCVCASRTLSVKCFASKDIQSSHAKYFFPLNYYLLVLFIIVSVKPQLGIFITFVLMFYNSEPERKFMECMYKVWNIKVIGMVSKKNKKMYSVPCFYFTILPIVKKPLVKLWSGSDASLQKVSISKIHKVGAASRASHSHKGYLPFLSLRFFFLCGR